MTDRRPCVTLPLDWWFDERESELTQRAQTACAACPEANTCYEGAKERGEKTGVWGGVYFPETVFTNEPTSDRIDVWMRANPGWHRQGDISAGIGRSSSAVNRAMQQYVASGEIRRCFVSGVCMWCHSIHDTPLPIAAQNASNAIRGPVHEMFIAAHPRPLTRREIVEAIGCHEDSASRVLAGLRRDGHIRNENKPGTVSHWVLVK